MAAFHVLSDGYLSDDDDRVGSTVSFVRVGRRAGGDRSRARPGTGGDPRSARGARRRTGDVTDVVISHHHPDHTLNVALFPNARLHDHWAWYRDDLWISRPAEGFELAPGVRLIETPGHSPQDISTLVDTDDGLVVATHLWWTAEGPPEDPSRPIRPSCIVSGPASSALPDLVRIVPGHGPAFAPGEDTPG